MLFPGTTAGLFRPATTATTPTTTTTSRCISAAEFSRKSGHILPAGEFISQLGPPISMQSSSLLPPKIATAAVAAALLFSVGVVPAAAGGVGGRPQGQSSAGGGTETLASIPQRLSGQPEECKKARIQRPKSRKAETCTVKCVNTCIRGGLGSPGEGPLNIRRPLVVFKPGFRSRQYCLVECSDICNLIGDGDDGP